MTAHNPSIEIIVDDKACAVIDRAYSYSEALRAKSTGNPFDDADAGSGGNDAREFQTCLPE